MQAAERVAQVASSHANDDDYESPYTQEALRQGIDIPWWNKVIGTTFKDGRLQMAYLKVLPPGPPRPETDTHSHKQLATMQCSKAKA